MGKCNNFECILLHLLSLSFELAYYNNKKKKKENPLHITILRNKIIIIIAKYYLRNLYTLKSREIVLGYASFGLNLKIDQIQVTTFAICLYHAQRNIHFANLKSNHSIPCSKSDLICSDLDSW